MQSTDFAPGGQPLVQFDFRGIRESTPSLKMNLQAGLHIEHKSIIYFCPFYIFVSSIIFFVCPLKLLYVFCYSAIYTLPWRFLSACIVGLREQESRDWMGRSKVNRAQRRPVFNGEMVPKKKTKKKKSTPKKKQKQRGRGLIKGKLSILHNRAKK